ncbi:tyrosine-type recombinase/integrase [bacterium]|nr:tyrosine-type recombinase/integrase [bacterium]
MPKPTKLRNRYYVRMPVLASDGRTKYKWIALGTTNLAEAQRRLMEVLAYKELIREGEDVEFFWRTGKPNSVKRIFLFEMTKKYLSWTKRRNQRLKTSTQEIYRCAMEHLIKALGKNFLIENISRKDLEKFRESFSDDLSLHTVKKNERAVQTFLRWLKDEGVIASVPKLRPLRIPRQQPVYVSEKELELIKVETTPFMAKVFQMYLETGMRLSEAFLGEIKNTFLVIQGADGAKNGMVREIPLKPEHIEIIQEMRTRGWTPKHYSRTFWKACIDAEVEGKKFHSLRHTFGIMSWLRDRDIFLTMKMMGHSNISTTQIYTQFHLSRIQEDFPSLVKETGKVIPFRSSSVG